MRVHPPPRRNDRSEFRPPDRRIADATGRPVGAASSYKILMLALLVGGVKHFDTGRRSHDKPWDLLLDEEPAPRTVPTVRAMAFSTRTRIGEWSRNRQSRMKFAAIGDIGLLANCVAPFGGTSEAWPNETASGLPAERASPLRVPRCAHRAVSTSFFLNRPR